MTLGVDGGKSVRASTTKCITPRAKHAALSVLPWALGPGPWALSPRPSAPAPSLGPVPQRPHEPGYSLFPGAVSSCISVASALILKIRQRDETAGSMRRMYIHTLSADQVGLPLTCESSMSVRWAPP